MTGHRRLEQIIGSTKMAAVRAVMGGVIIRIPKKESLSYIQYCKRKDYYDKLKPALASNLLGCTVRYFKKIRAASNHVINTNKI